MSEFLIGLAASVGLILVAILISLAIRNPAWIERVFKGAFILWGAALLILFFEGHKFFGFGWMCLPLAITLILQIGDPIVSAIQRRRQGGGH